MSAACNHTAIRYICTAPGIGSHRWYGCTDCGHVFEVAQHAMMTPEAACEVVRYPTSDNEEAMKRFAAHMVQKRGS